MADEVDYEEDVEVMNTDKPTSGGESGGYNVEAPSNDREDKKKKIKVKGRGHERRQDDNDRYDGRGGVFERIEQSSGSGPLQSIEGWIVIVTNIHPEAQEEDILDKFSEYGDVKNIHVNLDRRTGFVKGYALVEYENQKDAKSAIKSMNGKKLLDQTVEVDWAFVKN